ncbi:MAG: sigma-70 family RNA polymerase sigma factor [Gemmatimonadetes bacterium]|nr:sigma-70 family RNA polymerase sigma factor [Gemmatimonadota bacterium]
MSLRKGPAHADEIGPDLVRNARDGDPEALRELVERAYPTVRRWALVRTGDPAEADDLTQDVMVHVIQRLDGFSGSSRFMTWLYTVTRNAAIDRLRRSNRRESRLAEPGAHPVVATSAPDDPSAGADRHHIGDVVRAFFNELPHRQREVFDLAELQGVPAAEIAERLGIEAVSVRAHLFKARRTLRARILESHPELAEEWT